MSYRTVIAEALSEQTTQKLTAMIKDENDTAISSVLLTTLALTLRDPKTNTIVNAIDHVNILNTGRGTVDTGGNLTIVFLPADLVILTTAHQERRIALVEWTYATGAKAGRHEIDFRVQNFGRVP